jgi:hypothetical protein
VGKLGGFGRQGAEARQPGGDLGLGGKMQTMGRRRMELGMERENGGNRGALWRERFFGCEPYGRDCFLACFFFHLN